MRRAKVYMHGVYSGQLRQLHRSWYEFEYDAHYQGPDISLVLPNRGAIYTSKIFFPFFEGLLPEGGQLEALLRACKIDRKDCFSQLMAVGSDLVGAVTVKEEEE